MAKIIVTGATGLLGRALMNTLNKNHQVIGTGFTRAKPPILPLDLCNEKQVEQLLIQEMPDVVIHAAAERRPDKCENEQQQTLALNVEVSRQLASLCTKLGTRLFFISTDYVFDGTAPPYSESAPTNPLNFYGQSKAAAEQAILSVSPNHTIIRVPVLYGNVEYLAESAVTVITEQIKKHKAAKHDHWAIRYPTHVEDIALTIKDLIAQPTEKSSGIFHISDNQAMTKYDMACIIANAIGLDAADFEALTEPDQSAPRPHNCALKDTKLTQLGITHQRSFAEAVKKAIAPHL